MFAAVAGVTVELVGALYTLIMSVEASLSTSGLHIFDTQIH